jgi:hypothetical protein
LIGTAADIDFDGRRVAIRYKCYGSAECAITQLPLDYDKPNGAQTEIAVLRMCGAGIRSRTRPPCWATR